MKRVLVTLLAALSISAQAVNPAGWVTPSPLGMIIAMNSYIKDQKRVYYIRVESQAADFEQAKKQAFRLASEQVAGTVVLSESELRNSNLTRDEIITYSSGLIDEYKIVNRIDGPGYVKLTTDVWIVESVMAQRLLAKSVTEKGLRGQDLSTRAGSILEERTRGDNVFQAIMSDFPKRAFSVKADTPYVYMDAYRNTQVTVPITIRWDERFVNAFEDAAVKTGNKTCRLGCADLRYFIQGREFYDVQKLELVNNHIRNTNSTVMVELQSVYGQPVKRMCYLFDLQSADFYTYYGNQLNLNPGRVNRFQANLTLGQDVAGMATLENIRVEVVPNSQCQSM